MPTDRSRQARLPLPESLTLAGIGQTQAAHGLCSSIPKDKQEHYSVIGAGHYGIFSGRRWRALAYPVVRDFIAKHQG